MSICLSVCLSVYLSVSSHLSPVFGRLCSTFCSAVSPLSAFHLYTFGCLRDFHSVCPLVHLSISMSVCLMICQYLQYILSPYLAFAVLSAHISLPSVSTLLAVYASFCLSICLVPCLSISIISPNSWHILVVYVWYLQCGQSLTSLPPNSLAVRGTFLSDCLSVCPFQCLSICLSVCLYHLTWLLYICCLCLASCRLPSVPYHPSM